MYSRIAGAPSMSQLLSALSDRLSDTHLRGTQWTSKIQINSLYFIILNYSEPQRKSFLQRHTSLSTWTKVDFPATLELN